MVWYKVNAYKDKVIQVAKLPAFFDYTFEYPFRSSIVSLGIYYINRELDQCNLKMFALIDRL